MIDRAGPTIDLEAHGPTEEQWTRTCGRLPVFRWPECDRVVVVSPHPDDETLGAGGLIATAVDREVPVVILSVTDGEAASPDPCLARIRRAELAAAVAHLGPSGTVRVVRLGFADSMVTGCIDAVTAEIGRHVTARDLVVHPLLDDGHPDHRGAASAALMAARAVGATSCRYPVWAWHCHDPADTPLARGQRLELSPAVLERKRRAVSCFTSQIAGPSPVVPPRMLPRLLRRFEVLVREPAPSAR